MALQPASGVRDLNPQQVQRNHELRETLAEVFRLWGYEEVSPPRIERMDTLKAGGAIDSRDIVRLVSDEPLGLRPEMTASIARAACTRFQDRQRPLRLWSHGTVFEGRQADEGGLCIEENLHCGVELFGASGVEAELELLTLLMASLKALSLPVSDTPRLLIGHTGLMQLLLKDVDEQLRPAFRACLTRLDRLELRELVSSTPEHAHLVHWLDQRGTPVDVLGQLQQTFPDATVLDQLTRLVSHLSPLAEETGVGLQLDPTFQPLYELYDGVVFQLVCQGVSSPVVIARGGRYDGVVRRLGACGKDATGLGFSFCVDDLRDLPGALSIPSDRPERCLVCYSEQRTVEEALLAQATCHQRGLQCQLDHRPCATRAEAEDRVTAAGCNSLHWVGD